LEASPGESCVGVYRLHRVSARSTICLAAVVRWGEHFALLIIFAANAISFWLWMRHWRSCSQSGTQNYIEAPRMLLFAQGTLLPEPVGRLPPSTHLRLDAPTSDRLRIAQLNNRTIDARSAWSTAGCCHVRQRAKIACPRGHVDEGHGTTWRDRVIGRTRDHARQPSKHIRAPRSAARRSARRESPHRSSRRSNW